MKIISSPQLRTRQTAAAISRALQLSTDCDDAFDEIDFGIWTGVSFSELEQIPEWKRYNQFRSITETPGGESLHDVQLRAVRQMVKLQTEVAGQTVAIVSHADVIRSVIAFFSGTPLDLFLRLQIDPASFSIVRLDGSGVSIECVNRI